MTVTTDQVSAIDPPAGTATGTDTATAAATATATDAAVVTPGEAVRHLCEDLERHLGDPFAPGSRITYRRVLELDEKESYPHEELAALHAWGAHEHAVPARWGGRAENIETSLHLMRQVARRDPTVATALSITSLSYMTVWVAGSDEQRAYYGGQVRHGAKMSWGLSERDSGSDVLASGTVARRVPGGYRISGEKWLIGNATLADFLVLFVRTGDKPGPAAFSLLVLDKRTAPAACVEPLPHEPLHGLRGLDMSGVRLNEVFVPSSALVGAEGHGLEIALQSGHAVRSMITSIALGCTDTALRLSLDFATNRRVFGARVADIPYSRRQLVGAYADLLAGDAVATTAARSLQVCPEQSSVFSAVAKYWVPTLLEQTVGELAVVLGARHYLRGDPRFGVFQKVARDLPVANFADGNTVVNLKNIALQLGPLLHAAPAAEGADGADGAARVLFDLDAGLPPYRPWAQALSARGRDEAVASLGASAARLRARGRTTGDPGWTAAADVADGFARHRDHMVTRLAALRQAHGPRHVEREELFDLARQYCVVHAAACVAGVWAYTDPGLLPAGGPAQLLLACLERVERWFHPLHRHLDQDGADVVARALLGQHARGEAFSVRPARLAATPLDHLTTSADLRRDDDGPAPAGATT